MNNILSFPDKSKIREEASLWLARMDAGKLTPEAEQALRNWLHEDNQHGECLLELLHVFNATDMMSDMAELFPLQQTFPSRIVACIRRFRLPVVPATALAACMLIALSTVFIISLDNNQSLIDSHDQTQTTYATSIGEQATYTLNDGSTIILNTNSHVELAYTEKQRGIKLLVGEAYFDVAANPDRPFVVYAGTGMVRAVGTAFSIRLSSDTVEVTVTEGKVEVITDLPPQVAAAAMTETRSDKEEITLNAGHTAQYGKQINSLKTISPIEIARKLSWQQGILVFEGETLKQAINEISRYTNKKIVINGEDLGRTRIGGYFKAGDIEATFRTLENNFNIKINKVEPDLIYLTAKDTD